MDQKKLRFVPHVLPVLVGTTVEFPNSDPVAHNVFSISEAKRFNLGLYKHGTVRRMTFDRPWVVELLWNVHLEMSAYIVVLKNPYFARTAADGTYRIENVPAGQHRLRCWYEQSPAQSRLVEVPASGEVLMPIVSASDGSSTVVTGSGRGSSGSAIVSPIVTSGIPATAISSPGPASAAATRASASVT